MRVSAVLPAHNEEQTIGEVLTALRIAGPHELILVADSCTDATVAIAREHGARVVEVATRNVSRNRNLGVAAATGELLLLVDADTVVSPNIIESVTAAAERGCDYGGARLERRGPASPAAERRLAQMNAISRRCGLYYGSVTWFTRRAFERVAGYDEAIAWGEDVDITVRMRLFYRHGFLDDAWCVYCERKFEAGYEREIRRRNRNGLGYLARLGALAATGRLLRRPSLADAC